MKKLLILLCMLTGCAATSAQKDGTYSNDQLRSRAKIHTELGAGYLNERQYAIALEEFNEAIKIDPSYALAYNGLGLVYATLNEDVKAEENFKRSIQIDPGISESHNNYGNFLCSRNKIDEAVNEYLAAIKNPLYNTPQVAYANAGICSLKKNDEKSAEKYLINALRIDPLLHTAAYNLSKLYFGRGQYDLAAAALQNAVIANPTPEILWLAVRVERLRGHKDAEASYSLQLKKQYPNSEETKALISGK